jgi:hypothetical protein
MPVTATPIFPQTITTGVTQILPADTTTLKTLFTAGANGSKIDNILVTSTDTGAKDLQLVVTISAVDYIVGTFTVPANTGNTNSTVTLNALAHPQLFNALNVDNNGNRCLFLATGAVLRVKSIATVTATRVISLIAQGGNF